MILHAAKYPYCAVNGLLLASGKEPSNSSEIVDVMPLFHQCLNVSPMTEVALIQSEALAGQNDLHVAGYYAACELFHENTIDKAPGVKIADKIVESAPNAAFIIIDNEKLNNGTTPALHIWQNKDNHWVPSTFKVDQTSETLDAVSLLIERGAMKDLYDFDNHLDNVKNDWTNAHLNRDLQQLLAMY